VRIKARSGVGRRRREGGIRKILNFGRTASAKAARGVRFESVSYVRRGSEIEDLAIPPSRSSADTTSALMRTDSAMILIDHTGTRAATSFCRSERSRNRAGC